MDRFETEHDNFRAALDWLIEAKNGEWGVGLATALFRFWEMREYFTEGRQRLEAVLLLPSTPARDTVRMRALFAAGVLAEIQRDYEAAEHLMGQNLEIARRQE